MKYILSTIFILFSFAASAQLQIFKSGEIHKRWVELKDKKTAIVYKSRDVQVNEREKDKVYDVRDEEPIDVDDYDLNMFVLFKNELKSDESFYVRKEKYKLK